MKIGLNLSKLSIKALATSSVVLLHFSITFSYLSSSDMKQEQQDKYYDWLNWEAGLVYNNLTKNRIKQLITERGLISSRQKQADAMVEAMANGTLDVNGNEIANQSDMVSSYTRTMGFGGIWLLGLITGILSCGMIILGVFLR